jgi:hypothetical protein
MVAFAPEGKHPQHIAQLNVIAVAKMCHIGGIPPLFLFLGFASFNRGARRK